jgi:hypothetical protein
LLYLVVCKPNFPLTRFSSIERALKRIGQPELNGKFHRAEVIPVASDAGIWLIDFPDDDFPAAQVIPSLQVQLATKAHEDVVFVTLITKDSAYSMPLDSEAYKLLDARFDED